MVLDVVETLRGWASVEIRDGLRIHELAQGDAAGDVVGTKDLELRTGGTKTKAEGELLEGRRLSERRVLGALPVKVRCQGGSLVNGGDSTEYDWVAILDAFLILLAQIVAGVDESGVGRLRIGGFRWNCSVRR